MKEFSFRIFIISFLVIGLFTFVSIIVDEGVKEYGHGVGLFWIIIAKSSWIFSFPVNLLFWIFDYKIAVTFILIGLILNTFSLSLLIERLFYILKKRKIPPVPTRI
jgi:hypothetical protein